MKVFLIIQWKNINLKKSSTLFCTPHTLNPKNKILNKKESFFKEREKKIKQTKCREAEKKERDRDS